MAKLSARGRVEVVRGERVRETGSENYKYKVRESRAIMSDGNVLEKSQLLDDGPYGTGKWRPAAWRVYRRVKAGRSLRPAYETFVALGFECIVKRPDLLDSVPRKGPKTNDEANPVPQSDNGSSLPAGSTV